MAECGFLLAIVIILLFFLFLWLIHILDYNDIRHGFDECGNKINVTETIITRSNPSPDRKLCYECLIKFSQAEREIDTLCRSYIIERLCACEDASSTYDRIIHLCTKLGDYLAVCYGRTIGDKYAAAKKAVCQEMKNYIDECGNNEQYNTDNWERYECQCASVLAGYNSCLSEEFLINLKRDHCYLMAQMINAHLQKNSVSAMVTYNSLQEKTDAFVENIISATQQCKDI